VCRFASGSRAALHRVNQPTDGFRRKFRSRIADRFLPALEGLSMRGPWIPEFEDLVRFSEMEIPKDDGVLMIPGEDLFYYTTGRHPRVPVLMFNHTVNPYSPEQVLASSRSENIRWLAVKRKLQIQGTPYEDEAALPQLLPGDFQHVESPRNYDVYTRM
jgi:hypothetical protein